MSKKHTLYRNRHGHYQVVNSELCWPSIRRVRQEMNNNQIYILEDSYDNHGNYIITRFEIEDKS